MNMQDLINGKDTHLVDVRSEMEFEEQHAENAINIPLDEIPGRLEEFKAMNGPIVVYCRSGARSNQAMMYLKSSGIENVHNAGGVSQVLILQMNKA
jgi:phage shock protein E